MKYPFTESTYLAIHQNVTFERNETSSSGHTGYKNISFTGPRRLVQCHSLMNITSKSIV